MKNYKGLFWLLMTGAMISFASCDSVENDNLIEIPDIDDDKDDNKSQGTLESPYSVSEVTELINSNKTDVWAKGYIVGYKLGADAVDADGVTIPAYADVLGQQSAYYSNYNVYIAENADETVYSNCVSVQISSDFREILGLQSNPGNFGKEILVKGNIEKYNGVAGVKGITNYRLDGNGPEEVLPSDDVTVSGDASKAAAYVAYDFEDGTAKTDIVKEEWQNLFTSGSRKWQYQEFEGNKYAQATAYGATANVTQEAWLVTQGLDLSKAEEKVVSFKTQYQYTSDNNKFKVYILQNVDGATVKTEITDYVKPTTAQVYTESGNIDLSSYSGIVYLAFYYSDLGGQNSMTWRIDDIVMGKSAAIAPTTVSIKYGNASVFFGEELNCEITATVANGEGSTVITAEGLPAWATIENTGEGTAVIKGTAPSEVSETEVTIKAINNDVETTKTFKIVVKEKIVDPSGALVVNGNFENGTEGWSIFSNKEEYAGTLYTFTTNDGLTISQGATAGEGTLNIFQELEVEEGAKYKLTFKYKATHTKLRVWSWGIDANDTPIYHNAANTADPFRTFNSYLPIYTTDWTSWEREEELVFTATGFTTYHLEFRAYKQVDSSLSIKDIVLEKL